MIGDILAGGLASEGLRFLAGVERAEVRMVGAAGNAAVAAVDKHERTQRGTVLGAIGGHGSLQKEGLDFGIFPAAPLKVAWILPRLAILVAAFVFLYMFFGYYVAWRNPELQRFYGGAELATFWAAWRHNWISSPWIYALAAFRALLYVACLYPLVRMLHTSRRESALAGALFSACWTTVLLLPNPLMPASVARSHFWETLGFNLVFGALAGWLLCFTAPEPQVESNPTARLAA